MIASGDTIRPGIYELWELLKQYASVFTEVSHSLTSAQGLWKGAGAANVLRRDADETHPATLLRNSYSVVTDKILDRLREALNDIGQFSVIPELDRLKAKIRNEYIDGPDIASDLAHLESRVRDELRFMSFYFVPLAQAALYGQTEPFGPGVAVKFNITEDAIGAGNCLALGQPTACVFHLMRVMERGVHVLGRALKVKFDPARQSWFEICNMASKAATNRPAKTPAQRKKNAALGAAVSHLQTVRLAWRNEVMHPKQSYTSGEALEIYGAARAFFNDLAEIV